LETIVEESECSRASSQTSIIKKHRKEALSFSNKSALEDLGNEPQTAETTLIEEPGGTNLAFANKFALEVEQDKATEVDLTEDSAGLAERGVVITTSFRNVVAMRNMNGNGTKKDNLPAGNSPLLRYAPRAAEVPPDEVQGKIVKS
jgi:hypothetical protein